MAGIYVHIPFCKQACPYCNFHFSTSLKTKNDLVTALLKESALQRDYLAGEPVETVYFGGGTPSLLTGDELSGILETLRECHTVEPNAEITLEANPDDINSGRLGEWQKIGINRLSIGVQSFFEEDLRWMNRAHDARQALASIREAQRQGFSNISIDLIYGTPTLPDENWGKNLSMAIALGIPHLSCYALTVEPGTALDILIRRKKMAAVDPGRQAGQFLLLMEWMEKGGYEHYEISNFALPGKRSRHNSAYWEQKKYLGLGPSAHSYNGSSRQWNIANNASYIQSLQKNILPFEKETLSSVQMLNEYIMTSLRTREGLDLERVSATFGEQAAASLLEKSRPYHGDRKMEQVLSKLVLTKDGKLFADGIAAALFFENS